MLLEYADERSRGFYTGWQPCSQGLAAMVAALVALTLTNLLPAENLTSWGWRVAFVVGIMVIPVSVLVRRRLEETLDTGHGHKASTDSAWALIRTNWQPLLAGVLLMIGLASAIHVVVFYLPNYAKLQLNIPLSQTIWAGFVASFILALLAPFAFLGKRATSFFTLCGPRGWRTGSGLTIGDPEIRITAVYGVLPRVECGTYAALVLRRGRVDTQFYVHRRLVWGFGISPAGAPPCH